MAKVKTIEELERIIHRRVTTGDVLYREVDRVVSYHEITEIRGREGQRTIVTRPIYPLGPSSTESYEWDTDTVEWQGLIKEDQVTRLFSSQ